MTDVPLIVQHFPYIGIFILLILGGVGFPFPEDATLLLSGVLVAQGVIRPLPGILAIFAGLLLSDYLLYSVGKKYGRNIIEHKRFRKVISLNTMLKLEEKFRKWGVWILFLGRHIAGVRAQLFLVSGVVKIPPVKFLMVDAVSACFTIGIWGGIGYWGGYRIPIWVGNIKKIEHLIGLTLVGLAILGFLVFHFRLYRIFKNR